MGRDALPLAGACATVTRTALLQPARTRGENAGMACDVLFVQVFDTLYSKVLKELCVSRGSAWSLKLPA